MRRRNYDNRERQGYAEYKRTLEAEGLTPAEYEKRLREWCERNGY